MNNIDKQKERASNTEELLDHLIEIIENNDSRFSLEWSVGGETITMEIYDKLKNIGYAAKIYPIEKDFRRENQNMKTNERKYLEISTAHS